MAVAPAPPDQQASESGGALGLPQATALIMGSIIGTGVFALPASLAAFGPISLVAFAIVTVGAIALALCFGYLSRRVPGSGGPYIYAREAFGDFSGFLNAWSYWAAAWVGNAAIVVAWVGYVNALFGWSADSNGRNIVIALIGLWIPAAINLVGVKSMGAFQVVTTVLKFIPLLFIGIFGWFFIQAANFGEFNASGTSALSAISAAAAIALFAYLGVETASVAAGKVRNPRRNVPRATLIGTLLCSVVYLLGTGAVFGLIPHDELVDPKSEAYTAPFSVAADNMFGGTWAGTVVSLAAVISGIGALNGWTMICAEMPYAAAKDHLFPDIFARERRGVPYVGIIVATVLASAATAISYIGFDKAFTILLQLSVLTSVIPYIFSTMAAVYWFWVRGGDVRWPSLGWSITVSLGAATFSYWALLGSGYQAVYYGMIYLLLGIPIYLVLKKKRGEYGENPVTIYDYEPDAPEDADLPR